jgi:iodotyrosine deiodinase
MTHSHPAPWRHIPYIPYTPPQGGLAAARNFHDAMRRRRSIRFFSDRPIEAGVLDLAIAAAGSAPSGANKQPWRFVVVQDAGIKREIRLAAEAEERDFYARRAPPDWLADLAPLGTDSEKPFLETAPALIVVMKLMKDDPDAQGRQGNTYYVNESVGIAVGFLLAALHLSGLATLTHTPSPMGFLTKVLGRPEHERPFLLIPTGYPAPGCTVPDIVKKPLGQIMVKDRG